MLIKSYNGRAPFKELIQIVVSKTVWVGYKQGWFLILTDYMMG
jgi:hypothetical protein